MTICVHPTITGVHGQEKVGNQRYDMCGLIYMLPNIKHKLMNCNQLLLLFYKL